MIDMVWYDRGPWKTAVAEEQPSLKISIVVIVFLNFWYWYNI